MSLHVTEEELIEKGYHKFDPSKYDSRNATAGYQKCFYDEAGNKKYYLDVYSFDFTSIPQIGKFLYEANVQLYKKGTHHPFNIEFMWDKLDDIESFIDKLFEEGHVENYEDKE